MYELCQKHWFGVLTPRIVVQQGGWESFSTKAGQQDFHIACIQGTQMEVPGGLRLTC